MRLMPVLALVFLFVFGASACAKKRAPKSPATIESQKPMEPAPGDTGAAPAGDAEDSKEGTMKGDPCDGGESK